MATHALTSIPVHSDVVKRLRTLKTASQTWDEFLTEMAEDYAPAAWYAEMDRRRGSGEDIPVAPVLRRSRELARSGR
jgi:hypothetical protein